MSVFSYILIALAAVLVLFLAVIFIRALRFKPKNNLKLSEEEITFDNDKAVENLRELIRCKTVSYTDHSLENDEEFKKLISLLPKLYPNVFKTCEYTELPDRALLFKWAGKSSEKPSVLMAHYDVVPVDEAGWQKPPFDAVLEDGVIWGRGALDTKVTFGGVLYSADLLISQGFVPENDIYLAFSGGEEINGKGAVNIVDYFEEKGIEPQMVVDEGGAVVEGVFPGVTAPCGLIGIAEKGMLNLEYSCKSMGGHASAPKPHTPIVELANACYQIEGNPFKMHISKPVKEMFDTLGRHSNFLYRLIFANLWAFSWVLDMLGRAQGGDFNALLRTTVAFTQAKGSDAANVIPPEAKMVSNMRLNPEDTMDSAIEYIRKTVNNERVELNVLYGMNPSRISDTNCDGWNRVASAVASTWKGTIVSPYLMVQCSDSRHYGRITDKVYRFSAMDMTGEERATIHGHNERIRVEAVKKCIEFYLRLIKQC